MKVRVGAHAEQDLMDIASWIAADNPRRAWSFYEELWSACIALGDNARAYPVVRTFSGFAIRRCVFRDYLILYHVDEVVDIARILHGARDIDAALGGLFDS